MVNSDDRSELSASYLLKAIDNSVSLKLAVAGTVLTGLGFAIRDGAIPAFMVIWGAAFIGIGTASYAIIQYNKS